MTWIRALLLAALALALGPAAAASAQVLNNSEIPGSVLVFPKFITGTVNVGTATNIVRAPRSTFEISVVCPPGSRCTENQRVKLMARWVCPGHQDRFESKFICEETSFELFTTVKGTLMFHPEPGLGLLDFVTPAPSGGPGPAVPPGVTIVSPALTVAEPPCAYGYLIVWVISFDDADNPRAISFNGLIGNAVLRSENRVNSGGNSVLRSDRRVSITQNGVFVPSSASAYNAIPIQSVRPTDTILDPLDPTNPDRTLVFDGLTEYAQPPSRVIGTVRADRNFGLIPGLFQINSAIAPAVSRIDTYITLLTIDVSTDRSNLPVFVDLNFFNEVETLLSTFTEFICWAEKSLSGSVYNPPGVVALRPNTRTPSSFASPGALCDPLIVATGSANSCNQSPFGHINRNLREPFGRKLLLESGEAVKEQVFGVHDPGCPAGTCPVSLLGIVETKEVRVDSGSGSGEGQPVPILREYSYGLFHLGDGVTSRFRPN